MSVSRVDDLAKTKNKNNAEIYLIAIMIHYHYCDTLSPVLKYPIDYSHT